VGGRRGVLYWVEREEADVELVRKIERNGKVIVLDIKVFFDNEEMDILNEFRLLNYRIKTKDGSFLGKDPLIHQYPVRLQGASGQDKE
jgi:hypothetical protein